MGRVFLATRAPTKVSPILPRSRWLARGKRLRLLRTRTGRRQRSSTRTRRSFHQATRIHRRLYRITILSALCLFSPLHRILTGKKVKWFSQKQDNSQSISLSPAFLLGLPLQLWQQRTRWDFLFFFLLLDAFESQVPMRLVHLRASLVILAFSTHSLFEGMAIGELSLSKYMTLIA